MLPRWHAACFSSEAWASVKRKSFLAPSLFSGLTGRGFLYRCPRHQKEAKNALGCPTIAFQEPCQDAQVVDIQRSAEMPAVPTLLVKQNAS